MDEALMEPVSGSPCEERNMETVLPGQMCDPGPDQLLTSADDTGEGGNLVMPPPEFHDPVAMLLSEQADPSVASAPQSSIESPVQVLAPEIRVEMGDPTEAGEPRSPVQSDSEACTGPGEILDPGCDRTPPDCIYQIEGTAAPIKVAVAKSEYSGKRFNNFTKGCKWSPDGLCILTASDDNCLRLFNLPDTFYQMQQFDWSCVTDMASILKMSEGDTIYDYSWYPLMNSMDPATCCLASTSRQSPVHLWDAFTGELRATYRAYDNMDELVAASSIAFDACGGKLYCGFNNAIRVFDVGRPGRDCTVCQLKKQGQPGIISCIAVNPLDDDVYAAGSYLRSVGIYDGSSGTQLYCLTGQIGGVTHLRFSSDGLRLYSGGRKDPEILCWDLRNPGKVLHAMSRLVLTNQRMYFDTDASWTYLATGNDDGTVSAWTIKDSGNSDTQNDEQDFLPVLCQFQAHDDCVNGVSFNPIFPILATSSGQRKFPDPVDEDSSDEEMFTDENIKRDNSVALWWAGQFSNEASIDNETI